MGLVGVAAAPPLGAFLGFGNPSMIFMSTRSHVIVVHSVSNTAAMIIVIIARLTTSLVPRFISY
jgi:hypothetical protein